MPVYVDTILGEMIRHEANNKMSVLGVFGNAILVPKIPSQLSSLAIMQRWGPTPEEQEGTRFTFALEIRGPDLAPIRLPDQTVEMPLGPRPLVNMVLQIQGFPIAQQGDYQVVTYIDGQPRNVYEFYIGLPTAQQQGKLIGFT